MSDASRVALRYVEESTWGTIPTAALTDKRYTGEGLVFAIDNTSSQEIRSDRQITDLIQVGASSSGPINTEISYASDDDLFEGALWGDWGSALTITAATISAAASDNSLNDSGSGFPAFVAGQWIKISGFTGTTANNGYARVVSRTTAKIVIEGKTLVDDAAGESVTVESTRLVNGTTRHSYVFEKEFADLTTPDFHAFTGVVIDTAQFSINANQIFTATYNTLGKAVARATATVGTGGPNSAPTNQVMNAVNHVVGIWDDATAVSGLHIQGLTINIGNSLRQVPAIGTLGAADIGAGTAAVTGTMQLYFATAATGFYDKFIAGTYTGFTVVVQDDSGNAYAISMPRIKFSSMPILAGGINTDVLLNAEFTAIRHPTFGETIQISKF